MAEENILSISLKEYKSQIDDLKGSLLGLEKESDQYKSTVQQVQSMQNRLNSVLNDCKTTNSAVQGSYNALTAELSSLRQAWKSTADEVERSNIGTKMSEINNQLKELDASVGNYQRNVGDYSNQFQSAFSSMGGSIEGTFNSLQSLVGILPNLGDAFTSVGKKIMAMMKANPILLAISVAIAAIVAVCDKFKSAVSKNSDLQKRWNANMAAFKPILDMVNKAFNWLAEVIMDAIDWVMDNIPKTSKLIDKSVSFILDLCHQLVNAILFFPKTSATAFAAVVKIIGSAAKKIGSGLESIMEFFGMDEKAKKVKASLDSVGDSILNFGDGVLNSVETTQKAIDGFFQSAKERSSEFINNTANMMVASRKNAKEQQEIAKEQTALEEKLTNDKKQNIADRIKIKETENAKEKELLRQARKLKNEELAKEAQDLAKRKYLAKQQEYLGNGRNASAAEKAELKQLKQNWLSAGQELLQRNEELTLERSSSTTVKKAATQAGKAVAKTISNEIIDSFSKELKSALSKVKVTDIWETIFNKFNNLLSNNKSQALTTELLNKLKVASLDQVKAAALGLKKNLKYFFEKTAGLSMLSNEELSRIFEDAYSKNLNDSGIIFIKGLLSDIKSGLKATNISESVQDLTNATMKSITDSTLINSNIIVRTKYVDKIIDNITGLNINDYDFKRWKNGTISKLKALREEAANYFNAFDQAQNGRYSGVFEIMKPILKNYSSQFENIDNKSITELTDTQFGLFIGLYNKFAEQWHDEIESKIKETLLNTIDETQNTVEKYINDKVQGIKDKTNKQVKDINNAFSERYSNAVINLSQSVNRQDLGLDDLQDYIDSLNELKENSDFEAQFKTLGELSSKLFQLIALKKELEQDGVSQEQLDKLDEEITNAKIERDKAYLDYNQKILNKDYENAKKYADKKKKLQENLVNTISQSLSNMGSAMSTYASLRQSILEQDVKNGKKSEEEAKKDFDRTKKLAIAGAITSALGNSVSQTYSIWKSEQPLWSKIALTATMVPATLASLMATVNQIKATQLDSTSTAASAASISSVAVTPILDENQDVDRIQQIKAGSAVDAINDQKVYILESDIQKSNKRVAVREAQSTF